jgi:ABC-type antimicrobial peptide transport system permease subunit
MFGLTLFVVAQRTKEIGIRVALGARPEHIVAVVLRQFATPVLIGVLSGIGAAAALSQILRQELYGLSSFDPAAYLSAIAVFGIGVLLAGLLPAKRALRIDPVKALRYD